jgi:hypothetical protein
MKKILIICVLLLIVGCVKDPVTPEIKQTTIIVTNTPTTTVPPQHFEIAPAPGEF